MHVVVVPVLVEDVIGKGEVRGVNGELVVWGWRRRMQSPLPGTP